MHLNSLGILLPHKQWNRLLKRNIGPQIEEYIRKGEEEQLPVIFFSLESVHLKSLTCNAIRMVDGRMEKQDQIKLPAILYNPQKISLKKNVLLWRALCNLNKFHIINEHNVINNDLLFDMLKAYPVFQGRVDHKTTPESPLYCSLNQRTDKNEWQLTAAYARGMNAAAYGWDKAVDKHYSGTSHEDKKKITSSLQELNRSILHYLSRYFTGIDEIGLTFLLDASGQPHFCGVKNKHKMLYELYLWNRRLWQQALHLPIKRAASYSHQLTEEKNLKDIVWMNGIRSDADGLHQQDNVNYSKDIVWVKLMEFENNDPLIRLPSPLFANFPQEELWIQFGIKKRRVKLEESEWIAVRNSFYTPMEIYISSNVAGQLRFPSDFTYQLKYEDDTIVIGPTIGLLLGERTQVYNPEYMQKYSDRFGIYNRIGGLTIAFSPRSIDWEAELVYGFIYYPDRKKWDYGFAPIPAAVYRRNFHQEETGINRLIARTANGLFNSQRFTKLDLYYLHNEPTIKDHLPETHLLTEFDPLLAVLREKQKIILKPLELSRGRGILILEQSKEAEKGYILHDYRSNHVMHHRLNNARTLQAILKKMDLMNSHYLYQDYIRLKKFGDSPFDVRVVMQKNQTLQWQCTGIECRVAKQGDQITNVSRGGMAITLEHALNQSGKFLSVQEIKQQILTLSEQFCLLMDKKGHFSEFGLDIGIDENGYPWLIEANIFPSFKGFKQMDFSMYLDIRRKPLLYATALQGFKT
ncbi:YheC/YheD family protein [Paenibacillus beijingensis]|uniref:ATP-grasp domain-containing protein n=1 Tax=Paenibacillus beijingensis TaxID=1126833 RepID=A0A0D5NHJ1_9BACL|nr:YheC/YheD family protein [Paenibacillus beijingensis]AJY74849.1 hypothetical protein VN24_09920 [Paenibacillus beijingensis]